MDRATENDLVYLMRLTSLLDRQERSELTEAKTAVPLGDKRATFRRHRYRYDADGAMGSAMGG
jgi:hypothetical protein